MTRLLIRTSQVRQICWVLFAALAAFLPLVYYLAVVGGLLPYAAILIMAMRNLGDPTLLAFSLIHLTVYGPVLYWLARCIARLVVRRSGNRAWLVTVAVVLLLAASGLLPMYGAAHGQIRWTDLYTLYASGALH